MGKCLSKSAKHTKDPDQAPYEPSPVKPTTQHQTSHPFKTQAQVVTVPTSATKPAPTAPTSAPKPAPHQHRPAAIPVDGQPDKATQPQARTDTGLNKDITVAVHTEKRSPPVRQNAVDRPSREYSPEVSTTQVKSKDQSAEPTSRKVTSEVKTSATREVDDIVVEFSKKDVTDSVSTPKPLSTKQTETKSTLVSKSSQKKSESVTIASTVTQISTSENGMPIGTNTQKNQTTTKTTEVKREENISKQVPVEEKTPDSTGNITTAATNIIESKPSADSKQRIEEIEINGQVSKELSEKIPVPLGIPLTEETPKPSTTPDEEEVPGGITENNEPKETPVTRPVEKTKKKKVPTATLR